MNKNTRHNVKRQHTGLAGVACETCGARGSVNGVKYGFHPQTLKVVAICAMCRTAGK